MTKMTPERFQARWNAYKKEPQQSTGIWTLYKQIDRGDKPEEILNEDSEWAAAFSPKKNNNVPEDAIYIKKFYEGCNLTAYPDPLSGGVPWTIGWGTTRYEDGSPVKQGDKITQERAESLFIKYTVDRVIPTLARTIPHWNEMTDRQRAALISFSYNLGEGFYAANGFSTITTVLKEKDGTMSPQL
ncbi:hypothetical protein SCRM01_113c [Synechococcus phage S-CRM01]|uniref:endolysin n=1 Tax=Synechococcus phage S-CRM01 TaxID=1026955 RepID=UPI000209E3AD|nr:endolysin [Synechococcus phage S-CRM01]AEC53059.1 hypothetical protein SCRM01_113c [Synechococcus phage S-CRM01]